MSNTLSSVIPPTEEVSIRLNYARQLETKIREYYGSKNWVFSASHLALLFMIPMDVLKHLANTGKVPGVYPGEADIHLQQASDLVKECKYTSLRISLCYG